MKVTKDGLDYLIKDLIDLYNQPDETDFTYESIMNFVMNEQTLITLDPETDIQSLNYIVENMFNHI